MSRITAFSSAIVVAIAISFAGLAYAETFTLTVTARNGAVTIEPEQANYEAGAVVTLTAIPDPGYIFRQWSVGAEPPNTASGGNGDGSVIKDGNPLTMVMDSNKYVTAYFAFEDLALPQSPLWSKAITGNRSVRLIWMPNPEPTVRGYNIYRGDSETAAPVKIGVAWYKTSYCDHDVENGNIYYYRLKAFNTNEIEGEFSQPMQATPCEVADQADPARALVVYNSNNKDDANCNSVPDVDEILNYYTAKRGIRDTNRLEVKLATGNWQAIYDSWVGPVKERLEALGPENIYHIVLIGFPRTLTVQTSPSVTISTTTLCMNVYNLSRESVPSTWVLNPLYIAASSTPQTFVKPIPPFNHAVYDAANQYYYIAAQLEGIGALSQIEGSLYGEKYVGWENYLGGKHIIDTNQNNYSSKGNIHDVTTPDSYYDLKKYPYFQGVSGQALDYKAAACVRYFDEKGRPDFYLWHPGYSVVGAESVQSFDNGAPVTKYLPTLSYGGWYGFYKNVYNWLPGSFYSQVISYWQPATDAVSRGATFASFACFEPYTSGIMQPFEFVYYIMEGYTCGEAAAYGIINVNWANCNSGDPLTRLYKKGKRSELDVTPPPAPDSYCVVVPPDGVNIFASLNTSGREPDLAYFKLEYGTAPGEYTKRIDYDPLGGYWHNKKLTLERLTPNTTYYYRLWAQDPAGNESESEEKTFFIPTADRPPVFEYKTTTFTVFEGDFVELTTPPAYDPDGTPVVYTYTGSLPGNSSFDPDTRTFAWTAQVKASNERAIIRASSGGAWADLDIPIAVSARTENIWISKGSTDGADAANWGAGHIPSGNNEIAVFDSASSNADCNLKGSLKGIITRNDYSGKITLADTTSCVNAYIRSGTLDAAKDNIMFHVSSIIDISPAVNITDNFRKYVTLSLTGFTNLIYGNIAVKTVIFCNVSYYASPVILFGPGTVLDPLTSFLVSGTFINPPYPLRIVLRSAQEGTQYTLGDESISSLIEYLDIKDAKAEGSGLTVKNSKDSGNNTNINFLPVNSGAVIKEKDPASSRITIKAGVAQTFSLTPEDSDSADLTIVWMLDGVEVKTETMPQGHQAQYLYQAPLTNGMHQLQAIVRDTDETYIKTVWNITINDTTLPLEGDVNNDGKVDIRDLITVAKAFGSKAGDPNWNSNADINKDDIVNMRDLVIVARNFGRSG